MDWVLKRRICPMDTSNIIDHLHGINECTIWADMACIHIAFFGASRTLIGICERHQSRWRYDLIMAGVLIGFGLFGSLRERLQKGVELLWDLDTIGGSLADDLCLYCVALV
jgi:hypothetical protein